MPGWRGVAAVAAVAVATSPLTHRIPLVPGWLDLGVAAALDAADRSTEHAGLGIDWPRLTGWTVFNPGRFHGPTTWTTSGSAGAGFFEGYYYKLVTGSNRTVVVIPGAVYHGDRAGTGDGDGTEGGGGGTDGGGGFAFVMVGDPAARSAGDQVRLFKFPLGELEAVPGAGGDDWELRIGANRFGPRGLSLDIDEGGVSGW